MEYRVAVGDRLFNIYKELSKAVEACKLTSEIYPNVDCRIVYKNWSNRKGTPVYRNGKEIN